MHLIVGLGNPTKQYEGTRHNVGFETIDRIAAENQIRVEEKKHKALYGSGYIEGEKVILAKPQTFMNLSGESVRELSDYSASWNRGIPENQGRCRGETEGLGSGGLCSGTL